MNKKELINNIKVSLGELAFADIEKASLGGSKLGAFILCSCFIEYLAGFRYGKETNKHDYQKFVQDYLPQYNPKKIYTDLRCRLVHNYSEGGSYLFTDDYPDLHNQIKDGKIVLNLENFIGDIKQAMLRYFHELDNEDSFVDLAQQRLVKNDLGVIGIHRIPIHSPIQDSPDSIAASGVNAAVIIRYLDDNKPLNCE